MNRRIFLVVGLVAVLAAVALFLLRGRADRRAGGARSTAAAATLGGSARTADRGAAAGRALPDARTRPRASIAGTVRVKGGGALAGASVCTAWSAEGVAGEDRREPTCTTTDAAGAYRLAELVPGYHQLSAFAAEHAPAGWRDPARRRDSLELAPGEARTGVDFELAPGGVEVSGVVEDVSGGPIADALVTAQSDGGWWARGASALTRTDAQGRFTLWTKAGPASVSAQAEGYAEGSATLVAPSKLVEVLLTPESVLAGIVVEAGSRAPVEGAIVSVGDWRGEDDSDASARTDAQGRFRLTRLKPGRYKPHAAAQGGYGEPAESVLLGLGQAVEDMVIELHAAATVRGQVVIEDGGTTTPCKDGWVGLQDERVGRWEGDSTDDDGRIEVTALLPGHYEVSVWCEGYLAQATYPAVEVATADVDGLVWKVGAGGRITGVVKTAAGEPVADAHVSAQTSGGAARGQRSWGGDQTDADGGFALTGLVAGAYSLDVTASGERSPDPTPTATVPAGGEARVEITLPAAGTITGTVVDTDGKAVRGATVRVANAGWDWGADEGRTGDDGRFELRGVRPGDRRVVASRGWREAMRRPGSTDDDTQGERVQVVAGKTATVRLVVESRSGVITGAVTDEKGEPVVDAWVIASRESEAAGALASSAARQTRWSWGGDDRPVITGVDGKFAVRELSPGSYAIRAFRRGGGEAVAEHVKVGGTVALVIRSTGTIAGTARLPDGAAAPDELWINVADEKTGFARREKFLHTGGVFTMRDLPAGTFLVTADATGGRATTTVELTAGQVRTGVELVLERKVTVRGRMVELGTGAPVPGLQARVMPVKGGRGISISFGGGGEKQDISGDDGRFEVKDAPTGKVWIAGAPLDWDSSPYAWARQYAVITGGADAVDVGDIEVLRRRKKPNEPEGDLGFELAEQPPDLEPERHELKVSHLHAGGPAARAGLQVGDVIVSVDGVDVKGPRASRAWTLLDVLEGTRVSLGLARGETVALTAGPPR